MNQNPPDNTTKPRSVDQQACSIFERECCPHCGGKTGFFYHATIRGQQFMPWKNGKADAYFEDSGSKHGAYRCDDCGKTVKSNA